MCQSSIDPEPPSTPMFVIIRFSATHWQELCCCECRRLSLCAALNKHKESLHVPAYYHDNGRTLRRFSFIKKYCKGNVFYVW